MSKDKKGAKEVADLTSTFASAQQSVALPASCVEALTTLLAHQVPTRRSWWGWACSTPCALQPSKETPARHDPQNPCSLPHGCLCAPPPAASTEVQVEYWVDKGADVTGADYDKRTPLHIAAADGHLKVVKFLVRKGASVNAEDRCGHYCAPLLYFLPTRLLSTGASCAYTVGLARYLLQVWRHAHVRRHPREALRHHELPAGQGRRKARDGD